MASTVFISRTNCERSRIGRASPSSPSTSNSATGTSSTFCQAYRTLSGKSVGRRLLLLHLFDVDVQTSRHGAARHSLLSADGSQSLHRPILGVLRRLSRPARRRRQRHIRRPHARHSEMSNAHNRHLPGSPRRSVNRQDLRKRRENKENKSRTRPRALHSRHLESRLFRRRLLPCPMRRAEIGPLALGQLSVAMIAVS